MAKTVIFEKSKFLTELRSRMTVLESKTEATLASLMQEEAAANVENDLSKLVSEFKKIVTISPNAKFPDEIYAAVMQRVIAVEAPKITGGADVEGSIIKTIGAYISDLLDAKTETITVGGKSYVLSNPIGSAVAAVTVKVDSKTYTFTWDNTSAASQTAKSFMEKATNFAKERFTTGLLTALLKDGMATETGKKVKDGFIRWGKALLKLKESSFAEKAANEFLIDLGKLCSKIANYNTNYIGKLINFAVDGVKTLIAVTKEVFKGSYKTIVSITDKYTALTEKWDALDSYVGTNELTPTTLANSSEYKNFVKAFNALGDEIGYTGDFDSLIELYTGYKFTDVHDEIIDESRASVYGTSQDDKINVNGSRVRVYSGEGADRIISSGSFITIIGEQGNDHVFLYKEGDTYDQVDTGDGDDTISAYSGRNTINGGKGNDWIFVSYISKMAEKNLIYGGAGNDTITVASATRNTIVGEDGDDSIYISEEASNNTVSGGKGNDTINLTGSNYNDVTYKNGDGNDTIFGFDENDTLHLFEGETSTSTIGADVVVQVGNGSITIKDGAGKYLRIIKVLNGEEIVARLKELENNKSIWGTSRSNIIRNSVSGANIDSGEGNDTIQNYGGSSVTIDGGAGNDSIMSYFGGNVNIDGSDGNDSIYNGSYYDSGGSRTTINGGEGNDYIHNYGDSVKIDGSDGVDRIYNGGYYKSGFSNVTVNGGSNVTINGGSDNDYIYNYCGNNMKIDGGAGNDQIRSYGDSITIDGGDGSDSLSNSGNSVTIDGGDGNDTIYSYGASATIDGGAGNDIIDHYGNDVTINGGDGNDRIYNDGSSAIIDGGVGNDSLSNSGNSVTINASDGNDYIYNYGSSVTINGGAGDDSIYNIYGNNVTINGGTGNDTVYLNSTTTIGNVYVYSLGDGNDEIYRATRYDTISIGGGTYSTQTNGYALIINVGSGAVTLFGAVSTGVNIAGTLGTGSDEEPATLGATLNNTDSGVTLKGTANKDSLTNYGGDEVLITADADADTIFSYGDSVTVNAGAGDDIIDDAGINSVIDGGAGKDRINLFGGGSSSVLTVSGGLGDDAIYGDISAHIYRYASGDGNDTIFGFNSDDTLYVSTGNISSASVSGEDVVLKIGSGSVNLKAAKAQPIRIKNASGTVVETIIGGDSEETLPPDTDTLPAGISINGANLTASTVFTGDSIDLADYATTVTKVNASSLSRGISIVGTAAANFLKGGKGADTIFGAAGNDTISLGAGADVYVYESGNDLIQDYAADDKIKLASASITGSSLSGSNVILKTSSGNLTLKNGNDKQITIVDASGSIISTVISGGSSSTGVTIDNSNDRTVISGTSYADSIHNSGDSLKIETGTGNDTIKNWYGSHVTIDAGAGDDFIDILSSFDVQINAGDGNDFIDNRYNSSMTVTGGKGNDTIYNYYLSSDGQNIFQYASGDGNDTIINYDSRDIISISGAAYSVSTVGNDIVISVGSGKITLKDAKYETPNIQGTLKGGSDTTPAGITVKSAVLTASTAFTGSKIDLADYATTVTKVNASALSRGISIVGTAAANSLKGGKGADTISGGAGNDTVSLGGGADVYVYQSGNDLIQDYTAGADKIKLTSASITGSSLSGSNVVLKTSAGNVTVKNGKGKNITLIDAAGKETTQIYPSVATETTLSSGLTYDTKKTAVTLASSFSGTLKATDYASTVKKIDATKVSKSINIVGNSQANTIVGSSKAETIYGGTGNDSISGGAGNDKLYGEAGADTLYGGVGSDTLTGGDGKDVFVYANGDGADVIADFTAGQDSIKLTSGTVTSASLKSSDMVLKIGSGSLTVKNAKDKEISVGNVTYYNNFVYDAKKTAITLASSFSGTLKTADYVSTVKKIDASAVSKAVNIFGNAKANTIIGGSKAETISGGTGNDSISGGAGNDRLYGEAGNDKLLGGAGVDTLYGGAGADTLTGGDGKDIFVYSAGDGKDVVTDYTAGQDKIKIASGTISSTSYSGNNVIFNVGNGSITVQNGKGKKITIVDAADKTTTQTYSGAVSGRSALWFMEDDDNFITNAAELSDTFRDSCSESAIGNLSESADAVNLAAELAPTVSIFRATKKQ